ncbi:MAG TPA: ferritin family protein [Albitalea sp.]
MRESLLTRDPEIDPVTLPALVAVARTIERESVRRYAALAATMERRGEADTAAAFRVMHDEERKHVDAVERWARTLGETVVDATRFEWRLPADLASSWDDVAHSARLTPYRAFAIAVDNEQRAFALYSYLAAAATDPRVAAEAERLALEELRHASLMRRWRRRAWHQEGRAQRQEPPDLTSPDALHAWLAQQEAAIVARQRGIAARLRALGDEAGAQLLEQLAEAPSRPVDEAASPAAAALPATEDPLHLLVAAQEPLEALGEALEGVLKTTEGTLFAEAEKALSSVVSRIARLSLEVERRMGSA